MNGFEKRAALIKEKIKKATLEMLKTWEPKRIRIADISKTANVSQVTIYNYFGSKEALLREVLKDYFNKELKEFEEYMNGDYSVKEKIEHMIFQNKKSYSELTLNVINELLIEDHDMLHYIEEEYNKRVIPLMIQFINDGKASGEISSKISIQTFLAYINILRKHSKEFFDMAQQVDNPEFAEELVHLFFYGFCGKS
ncbi:TetR/AcrR family transcriptional regulator [Ectobacillus panaciterrae]|uniref:TetR/AcrR family transcriptional regulator n=1 Tax=Ectobacillus panaciterrae TaxID=363872 RepID=UPI0003F54E62|nr:TetR/AcrR family transcriptional regulator [Ectobacillus panaciterrae]